MCHYLDDYIITIGPPELDICQRNLDAIKHSCEYLEVPLKEDKC